MPKDHLNDQLIDVENNEEIIIERNNQCCNNKNDCSMLSSSENFKETGKFKIF